MDTSGSNSERSYSQEDIQQILHLAIARQADDQDKEFSYEQLVEIAGELDISLDSLTLAETDWLTQRGEIQQRQAFNIYRQGRFKKRFGNFAIINGFLLVLDFIGGSNVSWSLYILVLWGLTVVLDAWNTYQTKGDDYELAFQRWNRKHQIKQSFNSLMNKFLKFTSG
jgi:2TM domain